MTSIGTKFVGIEDCAVGIRIGLLGFGEVGQAFATELIAQSDAARVAVASVSAFDLLFVDPDSKPSQAALRLGVTMTTNALALASTCDVIVCAVTAANDRAAAQSVVPAIAGCWYLDLNSASPGMKQAAAGIIDGAGGRYLEAAVMSPIEPKRLASPILLGGAFASEFTGLADAIGLAGVTVFSDRVGPASATKLCRSVIIKGMEALLTESMLSARRYGVESEVLNSLTNLLPIEDWPGLARYMISRSIQHGARRAEEMNEAARTVQEAGIAPLMAAACAERQQWAPQHHHALAEAELAAMLDTMLARIAPSDSAPEEVA